MARHIAPEIPFTVREVRTALLHAGGSPEEVRAFIQQISLIRDFKRAHNAEAKAARLLGSTDPEEIGDASWSVGDELFATLACVSSDLEARVEAHMDARWDRWFAGWLRAEMVRRGLPPDSEPPREAVVAVRRKLAPWKAGWTRKRRRIARLLSTRAATMFP